MGPSLTLTRALLGRCPPLFNLLRDSVALPGCARGTQPVKAKLMFHPDLSEVPAQVFPSHLSAAVIIYGGVLIRKRSPAIVAAFSQR